MRLLDTDTCVELLRGNRSVIARRAAIADEVSTTWMTAAELYFGAERSKAPAENRSLVTRFLETLEVIEMDRPAAQIFGKTKAGLKGSGEALTDADLFIGSIAIARGAILVTGNLRHFERLQGIRIENWIR